jgi:ribosomal protein S18 acetylase RimI-like enzyme
MMIAIADEASSGSYEFTPFTKADFEPWRPNDFVLVEEVGDSITGCAVIELKAHKNEAEITTLAAKPEFTTAEAEGPLFQASEEWVANAKTIAYFVPTEDPRINWLSERGYSTEPGFCHFVAPLNPLPSEPKKPRPNGFQIRSMKPNEEDTVIRAVNEAYGYERLTRSHFERWRNQIPMFSEDWILLAFVDGEVAGAVCASQDVRYNQTYNKRRGYLGPGATLPKFRRKGINKTLNWYAMKFLRGRGMDEVSLYTAESNVEVHRLCNSLGYEHRFTWKRMKKTLRE